MVNKKFTVRPGQTVRVELPKKDAPHLAGKQEHKAALFPDEDEDMYVRRAGPVRFEFFDLATRPGGSDVTSFELPATAIAGSSMSLTADSQASLDQALLSAFDPDNCAPLIPPLPDIPLSRWFGSGGGNNDLGGAVGLTAHLFDKKSGAEKGLSSPDEDEQENEQEIRQPPRVSYLWIQGAEEDYLSFHTRSNSHKVTSEPNYSAEEVAVNIKAGSRVKVYLKPRSMIYAVSFGGQFHHPTPRPFPLEQDYSLGGGFQFASRLQALERWGRFVGGGWLVRGAARTLTEERLTSSSLASSGFNTAKAALLAEGLASGSEFQYLLNGAFHIWPSQVEHDGELAGVLQYKRKLYYIWRRNQLTHALTFVEGNLSAPEWELPPRALYTGDEDSTSETPNPGRAYQ
jgi:hypothetical protein